MSKIEKVLATGKTHTTVSAAGNTSRGHNGSLDIQLSSPGNAKLAHEFKTIAPHPTAEQLFAGAWSACYTCLLYTSPSPRDATLSRMPSSA